MSTFSLIVSLAAIFILRQPPKPIRLRKSNVFRRYLKTAGKIFAMSCLSYLASRAMKDFFPSYADLTPGLMLIAVYLSGKIFRASGPLWILVFCAWAHLEMQAAAPAMIRAAVISLGIPCLEWILDGIRFRLALTPSAKTFEALPGLLLILSLVALVCAGFYE